MTNRKFHKTVLQVVVLSEEPYHPESLAQIHDDTINGDCSGRWKVVEAKELDGKQAARALKAQASDPGFFRLTDKGEDLD